MNISVYLNDLNQPLTTINLPYDSTVSSLRELLTQLIRDKDKIYGIQFYTQTKPTSIMIPEYIFSDPHYFDHSLEANMRLTKDPLILITTLRNQVDAPDYEVEYDVRIRNNVTEEEIANRDYDVITYGIDSMHRGHPFSYFRPDDEDITLNGHHIFLRDEGDHNKVKRKGNIIRIKEILRFETDEIFNITPPTFITYTEDTSDPNNIVYFDAYLVHSEAFLD